jgi:hypothetical protein
MGTHPLPYSHGRTILTTTTSIIITTVITTITLQTVVVVIMEVAGQPRDSLYQTLVRNIVAVLI